MRKLLIALTLAAVATPMAPVMADPPRWAQNDRDHDRGHDKNWKKQQKQYQKQQQKQRYDSRYYYSDGRYRNPRALNRNDVVWRDNQGQYRCKRDNGTTGLIIGGAAGALLGRTVDTSGDRTLGTLIGAGAGALLGREVDRGGVKCR